MNIKPDSGNQHTNESVAMQSTDVTRLLKNWQGGDNSARDDLIALIYPDLRRLANRQLAGMTQMTLQPTALVHEAWLKLNRSEAPECEGRAHFMSLAARVMRQVAIDHARRRSAGKRDGGTRVTLDERVQGESQQDLDVLALDGALNRLALVENDKARIIEMHYFGGMSSDEIAEVMGCSAVTVKRGWRSARAWLREQLESDRNGLGQR